MLLETLPSVQVRLGCLHARTRRGSDRELCEQALSMQHRAASLLSEEVLQALAPYLVKSRVLAALLHTCRDTRAFASGLVTRATIHEGSHDYVEILAKFPQLNHACLAFRGVRALLEC